MSERGLTLLELLVALGITALLLVVVLPMMPIGSSALRVESTAREIAADLREAHATAIAGNRTVVFRIDLASGAFGHEHAKPHGGHGDGLQLALYTSDEQRSGAHAGTIRFFPDGGSTGGGIAVGAGPQRIMVLVDWLTGHISIAPRTAADDR
jgi:general secretion pathway protein H